MGPWSDVYLLHALIFVAMSAGSLAGQELVRRLEPAETCPLHFRDDLREDVSCGWLVVPQDRWAGTGTPMRLAYAVAHAA
ncbi:MAG: hypothetical protein WD960_05055 [Gemmatimonadota bacterium]